MALTTSEGEVCASAEDQFWRWFMRNETRLFAHDAGQEVLFNELGAELSKVHDALTFEFSPVLQNGKREFVISAAGIKSAFPAVESLFSKAPTLERWVWIKYRPRRPTIMDIQYGGKTILAEDVHYLLAKDQDKVGIVLFFDGYNEREKSTFGQIGYLMLDEALGEYAVEMQVGFIEFHSRDSKYFPQASPLRELPAHFSEYWARTAH